ncbi:uncharacterized protein LOC116999590 isoform X1 [Catharus ustulatus]|uniref:uncharacterized protein LOC116999590 isoform X1 n=1 Tax=Catharus ustulatus TaxID=91951 RepID=UPI00140CD659|nr:uncharacterized protein LOC116999590 isoform X1 [Catharus ustulatus]XP_032922319.1 uncharacterized protein LOC116999590 isoform X1 [Catharus ustulatus]
MFSWHRSFTLGAPWRRVGKKSPPAEDKVVLTHMKILSNEGIQNPGLIPEAPADTACTEEPHLPSASLPPDCRGSPDAADAADADCVDGSASTDYVATLPDLSTFESKCRLHRFSKFESEDSGVELPSGANSPSTPTGSEKSFVLHSRDSFCDSGVLSTSSSPEIDHQLMRTCKEHARKVSLQDPESKKQADYYSQEGDAVQDATASLGDFNVPQEESPDEHCDQGDKQSPEKEPIPEMDPSRESTLSTPGPTEEPKTVTDDFPENFGSMQDLQIHEHQLKKYPTTDSLDEYMDECCRLSEVNQSNSKALGSGLGYLEHICQLIEKIGQLQEHNLRLQKQVCSLQKEQKMSQIKEEYLLQHCSCGAVSIFLNSYQDMKTSFAGRSRPHSLFVQTGNPSDLSIIPEIGANTEKPSNCNGSERYLESGKSQLIVGLRKSSNNRNNKENEFREAGSMEGQAFLSKDPAVRKALDISKNISGESHAWRRMRDLMRKTRLTNQNKLGLSSAALKRSCPQLYRPDIMSSELRKTERNSMIVLGQNTKNENLWPF